MKPTVLNFIICDRVRVDAMNLHLINIEGLRTSIRSRHLPPFPLTVPVLTTLAIFMGGQGSGELSTRVIDATSGQLISASIKPHRFRFVGNPLAVKGVKILVPNCKFPRAGLYWIQLVLSGEMIASQPLRVHS